MASISETSDDGSNGGDPNQKPEEPHKNPQEGKEEENQNEKPKEDDHQEEEVENVPQIPPQMPLELIVSTIATLRRCHYPTLSLLSDSFRQVISSVDLFQTRSLIGSTEPVLYTLITFTSPNFEEPRWFILQRRNNTSLQLSLVTSLPPMFPGCTTVTIGHKIYVMGGLRSLNRRAKTVFVIDCRFHTWRYLQEMQMARSYAASAVIDGMIYVVGGSTKRSDDWVEVFNVETNTWENVPSILSPYGRSKAPFNVHFVLDNKIYILDGNNRVAYDLRGRRWEDWGPAGNQLGYFWQVLYCVVDDLLYAVVPDHLHVTPIVVYDPREMGWRPVMGVDYLPNLVYSESRMTNFGGNLMILGCYQSQARFDYYGEVNVWCVEVALERREDGEIWGKVQSLSLVNKFRKSPVFVLSRTVTV
ncbi:Kelch repeat type 1 [Arabidopsis suecica]|uniref:Kelch repeat type 1 n=1 Tax=Arabidopsis suecica TaxID=45249 RepID=A0A8T2G6L9_ARASU|nr:Kelch repeat type 1 [Arabidopsis suecica]